MKKPSTLTTVCWVQEGRQDELLGLLELYLEALHRLELGLGRGVWRDPGRSAVVYRVDWAGPEAPTEAGEIPMVAGLRTLMDALCREQRVSVGAGRPGHLDLQEA